MTGGTFFRTDRFMPALAILAVSAGFMFAAKRAGWLILIKKPLPIRRPLIDFDRDRLLPYRVVSASRLSLPVETSSGETASCGYEG